MQCYTYRYSISFSLVFESTFARSHVTFSIRASFRFNTLATEFVPGADAWFATLTQVSSHLEYQ